MNNSRPISNLLFISKLFEKLISANNLLDPYQSCFQSGHSTETALLKITNGLLISADSGCLTVLIMLDVTAAFDTVSHHILTSRQSASQVVLCLGSYHISLIDNFLLLSITSNLLCVLSLKVSHKALFLDHFCSVFILLPLGHIIHSHVLSYHFNADDLQIYQLTPSLLFLWTY